MPAGRTAEHCAGCFNCILLKHGPHRCCAKLSFLYCCQRMFVPYLVVVFRVGSATLPGDPAPPPLLRLRYCVLYARSMCFHRLRSYVLLSSCHFGASCNSRCVGFCVCSPLLAGRVAQRRSSFCQINCMLMVWRVYVHFMYGMSRMHRWLGLGLCGFCSFTSRWLPSWLAD